jgi:hypothetical protein
MEEPRACIHRQEMLSHLLFVFENFVHICVLFFLILVADSISTISCRTPCDCHYILKQMKVKYDGAVKLDAMTMCPDQCVPA